MELLIIFFVSLVATLLSSMSGGGASIINLPVYLSLGMSFPLATAVQKVSSAFWVLPAAYNYLHDRKVEWRFLILFSVIGLFGAYLGVQFVLSINERILELIVGWLILGLVVETYFRKEAGLSSQTHYPLWRKRLAYPGALILGFYESIFGAGNGILFASIARMTRGFDFISSLGYYFAAAFLWCVFAAYLLIQAGHADIPLMATAAFGSVVGAVIGSRYAKYKGNKFIRIAFLLVGGVLGLKLILGI